MGRHGLDYCGSGQGKGQLASCCECGNKPSGSINLREFLTSLEPVGFSGRILLHGVSHLASPFVCLFVMCCTDLNLLSFLFIIISTRRDVPIKNERAVLFCALEVRPTC
jgi:hypothetical protein